jgi:MFS transporter, PAT family, beta-lactamase induction signal transducer AmpG
MAGLLSNPLGSTRGRLVSFFLLYVTEGIPQGFTAVAIAAQMRRQGLSPAEIGGFVAALYLPWSWKFAMGPAVDLIYSERLGKRRAWIVGCQLAMVLTLLPGLFLDYKTQLTAFTVLVLVHNIFAATQDVAIDALACATLPPSERGLANGLMFAGAYIGNALGGAGVLLLMPQIGMKASFIVVAAMILTVTLVISLRLKEPAGTESPQIQKSIGVVLIRMREYGSTAWQSFFGTRQSIAGLLFGILPAGAYALSLALQSNLAVELGLPDEEIGLLQIFSTILAAGGCVLGGILSDRFGRKRMIALYIISTAIPTIYLAMQMQQQGWIMPLKDVAGASALKPAAALIQAFWIASLSYSLLQGLMYGTRTALYMDICNPLIAATQFTAFMSLLNFVIAYSAWWQGRAVEAWGYPTVLCIDAAFGCLGILFLPLMGKRAPAPDVVLKTQPETTGVVS